jgi:hypothetical protein
MRPWQTGVACCRLQAIHTSTECERKKANVDEQSFWSHAANAQMEVPEDITVVPLYPTANETLEVDPGSVASSSGDGAAGDHDAGGFRCESPQMCLSTDIHIKNGKNFDHALGSSKLRLEQ